MTWDQAFSRLSNVRDELEAARFAVVHAQAALSSGRDFLHASAVKPSHIDRCASNLELTYLLRLFAEFEDVLRDYWAVARPSKRRRRAKMEVLLNRIAVLCSIPYDAMQRAHEVRDYRNNLVHSHCEVRVLTFNECKSRLGVFLSFLPTKW